MYNTNQNMIDNLLRQKDRIDEMIKNYQQPQVNNFITPPQISNKDLIEWRVLNENEEVDNLYVANKTLFINDSLMVLKGVDGSLDKWEVKKIWPVDKKDEKINALEEEIRKLKEVLEHEHSEPTKPVREFKQPDGLNNVNVEPKPKTGNKYVSKQD